MKNSKPELYSRLIIVLVLVSFFIALGFSYLSPHRGWDESVYLNLAQDLSENPLVYSLENSKWNDYILSSDPIYGWPNIGFRAPLLPHSISLLFFLNLNILIIFFMPAVTAGSVYLVYLLGKSIFDKKVGFYSAMLFSLLPIVVYCGSKIWTDTYVVFFLLLTFISFWKGFEEQKKTHKILFGIFLALSLLARYTTLWIIPVFLIYLLIRNKSLIFLKDKFLWFAVVGFLCVLTPWLIYNINNYNNIFGSIIYGFQSAHYWGGVQPWNYFLINSWQYFSIIGLIFCFSLIYILVNKKWESRGVILLLVWGIVFSIMVMTMPHKEERFIMPLVPVLCILSGLVISRINNYRNVVVGLICMVLFFSLWQMFKKQNMELRAETNICFSQGMNFISGDAVSENSVIINNQSPIVHYYTGKKVVVYPNPWSLDELSNQDVYIYFANYDMNMLSRTKRDLDNNFEKVFECKIGQGYSAVYK